MGQTDGELARRLHEPLARLLEAANQVWVRYQDRGPGRLDCKLFDPVDAAQQCIANLLREAKPTSIPVEGLPGLPSDWKQQLGQAVDQVHDLSERCSCRPEGLCFITGEAGLIPRRDWLEAFPSALDGLSRYRDLLQAAAARRPQGLP